METEGQRGRGMETQKDREAEGTLWVKAQK